MMQRRGFTLIELMVTVLVTSIVVIAAYTLLDATTSNFKNEDDGVELRANLRNTEMILQRDISRIGYRTGYSSDVPVVSNFCATKDGTMSNIGFQAIRHARNTVNGKAFSQLTMVGDITDYGAFEIQITTGGQVVLKQTKIPAFQNTDCLLKIAKSDSSGPADPRLTCSLGHCFNCEDGFSEENADEVFDAAVVHAFGNAGAVRVEAAQNMTSVIRGLTSFASTGLTLSGSSFTDCFECGFGPMGVGDHITPITAITYTVMAVSDTENALVRCMHSPDIEGKTGFSSADVKSCSVVLRNVDYFDVYPYTSAVDPLATMKSDSVLTDNYSVGNINIVDITALAFRVGIHGTRPLQNAPYDACKNGDAQSSSCEGVTAATLPQFYVETTGTDNTATGGTDNRKQKIYHRAHLQSSAMITSRPSDTASCNSLFNTSSAFTFTKSASN